MLSIYPILGVVSIEVQHMRKSHSLKLSLKVCLLCCSYGTTLLLLYVRTLSSIVHELLTNKSLHFSHSSPLTTALTTVALSSSTPLWWGPKLGTLPTTTIGLILSLYPKRKILLTLTNLLLLLLPLSRSLSYKPNLLLDEVIPHPLPCRHDILSNNASYKWTPRFGESIHSLPHQSVRVHNFSDSCRLAFNLSVTTKE
jgi:hypothetical protein